MKQRAKGKGQRAKSAGQKAKSIIFLMLCSLFYLLSFSFPALAQQEEDSSLSYYEAIEERNFFRPKKEAVFKKEGEVPDSGKITLSSQETPVASIDFILTGVAKIKGRYKAIVEKKTGEKSYYVQPNDSLEDYTVRDIRKNEILLEKNEQVFVLKLKKTGGNGKPEIQNEFDFKPEQKKEDPSESPLKYEGNIMQKLRMGWGDK